jgi:hypothetical protein
VRGKDINTSYLRPWKQQPERQLKPRRFIKVEEKLKFTPEQATKAHRGSRDIATLFL